MCARTHKGLIKDWTGRRAGHRLDWSQGWSKCFVVKEAVNEEPGRRLTTACSIVSTASMAVPCHAKEKERGARDQGSIVSTASIAVPCHAQREKDAEKEEGGKGSRKRESKSDVKSVAMADPFRAERRETGRETERGGV